MSVMSTTLMHTAAMSLLTLFNISTVIGSGGRSEIDNKKVI